MTPFTIRLIGKPFDVETRTLSSVYFNTTNETGETLKTYRAKAAEQDARILAIMQDIGVASPSQVHKAMNTTAPLTSVRRAMTNLTNAGKLTKMEHKIVGPFGRREHTWKIVTP